MKYRMYVDEVGHSHLGLPVDSKHRFLSLTGVIIHLEHVRDAVSPRLEALKRRYFDSHPDEPICLHRKELLNAQPPFEALADPALRAKFDEELLGLLRSFEYRVVTVVVDKEAHLQQYQVWQYDPYHYAMMVLLERYVMDLTRAHHQGDVMAESRGGKEDMRLKKSFEDLVERGTDFVSASSFEAKLTSRQLKVKSKANNIASLQLADLVAYPSFRATQARRNKESLADDFGGRIAAILEAGKYLRSQQGKIDGWGRKWLP